MRPPPPYRDFQRYPVSAQTIGLAVLVSLVYWSGKYDVTPLFETGDIRRGQVWRILTSTLPHANFFHLAFNCYWTWVFGTLIESTFGHLRTLAIFILLAVAANGAEFALAEGGIGLSGIGYGLFGLIWALSRHDRRFAGVIDPQTVTLFTAWFFFCIVITYAGMPIANIAHGVGAMAGAILGWAIALPAPRRYLNTAWLVLLLAFALAGSTVARPYVNLAPNRGDYEAHLGYTALTEARNEEALAWLLDATYMKPKASENWFNLGICYSRLHRFKESEAAFKRARELKPTDEPPGTPDEQGGGAL